MSDEDDPLIRLVREFRELEARGLHGNSKEARREAADALIASVKALLAEVGRSGVVSDAYAEKIQPEGRPRDDVSAETAAHFLHDFSRPLLNPAPGMAYDPGRSAEAVATQITLHQNGIPWENGPLRLEKRRGRPQNSVELTYARVQFVLWLYHAAGFNRSKIPDELDASGVGVKFDTFRKAWLKLVPEDRREAARSLGARMRGSPGCELAELPGITPLEFEVGQSLAIMGMPERRRELLEHLGVRGRD